MLTQIQTSSSLPLQVQTVSISYLRCLIEHVRCYILDRDIELIYYTIRKSSDVLTRDPMQLGAQVNMNMQTISHSFHFAMVCYDEWIWMDDSTEFLCDRLSFHDIWIWLWWIWNVRNCKPKNHFNRVFFFYLGAFFYSWSLGCDPFQSMRKTIIHY